MSAIQQLITEHLDIWTAADAGPKSGRGRSSANAAKVYGISKLRELILELAMRGKLVPQDASDEPASVLLKRSRTEKSELSVAGEIRKEKSLSPITESEKPFELPDGWSLDRLGNLAHVITKGTTPTSIGFTYQKSGIRFVKVENVSLGRINLNSIDQYISEEADEALSRSRLVAGDVLFSIAGTIGRTCIIHPEDVPANTNQAFAIVRGTNGVFDQVFLLRQLDSFVSNKTKERARGGAMYNVSLSDLADLVLIIPPRTEQHRIVAKVDELMALCDQLESEHNNATEANEKLVSHLLGTLTKSQGAEEYSANWQRIATHFDALFTTESSIDALKKTMLQLAVMGKLAPQDPNDEPASELLKRIQAEKAKLIAEGKIRKEKPLAPMTDEEMLFELPAGWEWVRLGVIGYTQTGTTPSKSGVECFGSDIPFIKPGDIYSNHIDYSNEGLSFIGVEQSGRVAPCGSLLMVCIGTIGKCNLIDRDCSFNQQINSVTPCIFNSRYLLYACRSPYFSGEAWGRSSSTTIAILNKGKWEEIGIPVPPLAEQNRIVAKVDELMVLCDKLNHGMAEGGQLQKKLADTIVENVVA